MSPGVKRSNSIFDTLYLLSSAQNSVVLYLGENSHDIQNELLWRYHNNWLMSETRVYLNYSHSAFIFSQDDSSLMYILNLPITIKSCSCWCALETFIFKKKRTLRIKIHVYFHIYLNIEGGYCKSRNSKCGQPNFNI